MTRAEIFRYIFDNKMKSKGSRKIKIVSGVVTSVNAKSIDVHILNNHQVGKCSIKDISDYPIMNLNQIFKIGFTYKFIVKSHNPEFDFYVLNYKSLHPEEMKRKVRPVPTASHYRNLSVFLNEQIDNYKK